MRTLIMVFIILLGSLGKTAAQERVLEPFTLQLRWTHQAQFMGYYAAEALGYYESEGLTVDLRPGGPDESTLHALEMQHADAIVEWLPTAVSYRQQGFPLTNIAQIFQTSSLMVVCDRTRGIRSATDLVNKRISVWPGGSAAALSDWIASLDDTYGMGLTMNQTVPQYDVIEAWRAREIDCVSATSYNEFWQLLDGGVQVADTTIFRLGELNHGLLEDGLYVDERRLEDPDFVNLLTRFLRASLKGWEFAVDNPSEALEILLQRHPGLDRAHQERMAEEVTSLVNKSNVPIGLLYVGDYERSQQILNDWYLQQRGMPLRDEKIWTDRIWRATTYAPEQDLPDEVLYHLDRILSLPAFYILDLIGTLAFGIAGFARAQQRRYDIWGAIVLTSLPAVGGGTLRDLLVGGDRHPPFIFNDPNYIYIILLVVILGSALNVMGNSKKPLSEQYPKFVLVTDTIGLAAFSIIGAKVAILAQLDWFWIPCLAALTCAGGGIMLDIISGREPSTFQGIVYEEVAIFGGLFLFGMLYIAEYAPNVPLFIGFTIVATFLLVFTLRLVAVSSNWRTYRLGPRALSPDQKT